MADNEGLMLYTNTSPGYVHLDFENKFKISLTPDEALALADLLTAQAEKASAADDNRKPLYAVSEFLQKVMGET